MHTDIFSSVEFQMSLLLFVALSGYVLASFISQPAVVGEILAGIEIGCGIPAKMTRMSPRGEVAMIVALLALQQNIIQQSSFVAIILMSVITTLIVPILLRQLMKTS